MYANVNLAGPFGLTPLLGAGLPVLLAIMTLLYALITKRLWLAKLAAIALVLFGSVYLAVIVSFF
jgi:hypothetical protein